MSKFRERYGSKWLKPIDIDGKPRLQIGGATWEEVGQQEREEKLVLQFIDQPKRLILNSTNANALADEWGENERDWVGRWVEARTVETALGEGVRIKPCEPPINATVDVPF